MCLPSSSHISQLLHRHGSRESAQQLCVGRARWTQASSVSNQHLTYCFCLQFLAALQVHLLKMCIHLLSCSVGLGSTQMHLPVQIILLSLMTVSAEKASLGDLKCLLSVQSFSISIFFWCGKRVHSSCLCRRAADVMCSGYAWQHWKQTNTRKVIPCMVGLVCHSDCCVLDKWPEGGNPDTTQPQTSYLVVDTPRLCAGVLHMYCHLKTLLHICTVSR